MSIRNSIQKTLRSLMAICFLLAPIAFASTAQADMYLEHIPSTVCKSSQLPYLGDRTQYQDAAISVLPSSSLWDYDIIMCPISRFNPDSELIQIRVNIEGANATRGWCQLYVTPDPDRNVDFKHAQAAGTNRASMTFQPPSLQARNGALGATARCLVFPGDRIRTIDLFWDH